MIRNRRWKIIAALTAVYLIWSSTYLAIRFAVDSIPPFFMAGSRFFVSGVVLLGFARMFGPISLRRRDWIFGIVVGALLPFGGNGGVSWAAQWITSGFIALMIATVALWAVLLDWVRPGGSRPETRVLIGVIAGLFGVFLLLSPNGTTSVAANLWPWIAIGLAALSWASGSVYSRHAPNPPGPAIAISLPMICGGLFLFAAGAAVGEIGQLNLAAITPKSAFALLYLTIFGTMICFPAYIFLTRETSPSIATTYAFVNPALALVLAWLFDGEVLSPRQILGGGIIIAAVAIIILGQKKSVGIGSSS